MIVSEKQKAKRYGVRYPWGKWFAALPLTLVRGVHFDCLPHGFRVSARVAAARVGLRIRVLVGDGTVTLSRWE